MGVVVRHHGSGCRGMPHMVGFVLGWRWMLLGEDTSGSSGGLVLSFGIKLPREEGSVLSVYEELILPR